jgi:cytoskeleton protein RodZ
MPTIGEQLKQAREARKLTVKQAVLATRVRSHYLEAMEADDFSAMPSNVQARGFLRLYAEFLGLNTDELITHQAESTPEELLPVASENPASPEPPAAAPEEESSSASIPVENPKPEPEPQLILKPGTPPLSQAIFNEIGLSMRERRELISLTLDEVERHTHVRKHNLEMIEEGFFDELASPVQARGMLNAYASFLDMDSEAVLLRYADAIQSRRVERQQAEAPRKTSFSRRRISLPIVLRRFISPDLVFGGGMILIMLGLSVWGATRIFSDGRDVQATPTSGLSISDVLLASPVVTLDSTEGIGIPTSLAEIGTVIPTNDTALTTETETPVPTVASAVQITVVVVDRTFLRVIVDGEIKQDGRVPPGAALTFDGNERIEVLTGSGTAIQIIFNQRNLGQMGNMGEVVNRIYTVNGVETPTPTPSPTPSITPIPSKTLRSTSTLPPTATPRPTSTPRPTATINP